MFLRFFCSDIFFVRPFFNNRGISTTDMGDADAANNAGSSNSTDSNEICWPNAIDSPFCWWVWILLVLLLLLLCCFLLFCCWRSRRPRVFVRLYQAGKLGKTKKDEMLFTIYIQNTELSMLALVDKVVKHKGVPADVVNGLKFDRSLGLFHGKIACTIDEHSYLRDYSIMPLTSKKAPGINKKQVKARFAKAVLDIRPSLMQNPMGGEQQYSPRTKISMMSQMQNIHFEGGNLGFDMHNDGFEMTKIPVRKMSKVLSKYEMASIPLALHGNTNEDEVSPSIVGIQIEL